MLSFRVPLLALLLPALLSAQEVEPAPPLFSMQAVSRVAGDAAVTVAEPARWKAPQLKRFAWSGLAVIGTALLLDGPIRDASHRHASEGIDRWARRIEPFGEAYAAGIIGGFAIAGFSNDRARAVALDGLSASLAASGIVTPILKFAVGRRRPEDTDRTGLFKPFQGGGGFPSNHAAEAFTLAAVVSGHYDSRWIRAGSYGLAGLVGLARIRRDAHWTSDVLAGALIGHFTGRAVVDAHRPGGRATVRIAPYAGPGAQGIALSARF